MLCAVCATRTLFLGHFRDLDPESKGFHQQLPKKPIPPSGARSVLQEQNLAVPESRWAQFGVGWRFILISSKPSTSWLNSSNQPGVERNCFIFHPSRPKEGIFQEFSLPGKIWREKDAERNLIQVWKSRIWVRNVVFKWIYQLLISELFSLYVIPTVPAERHLGDPRILEFLKNWAKNLEIGGL